MIPIDMLVCGCSGDLGTEKSSRAGGELGKCEEKYRKGSVCINEVGNSVDICFEEFFFGGGYIKEMRGLVV